MSMVRSIDDARRAQRSEGRGRVIPHDLGAEESLIGAMLLSRDAIVEAVQICTADDFHKPAHGHVFDAICSLYSQGEPADPVTVADELRRAGLLEAVGGPPVLVSLQANTPAIGNAPRYARIVEEHALLRKLIAVGAEITELGFDMPDDVAATIDKAETLVFQLGQRRVADTLAPLRDLLEKSLDHLEALYERGEAITGIPTGYTDLDDRLAGLQPNNLVILGARPSMGKALPLDTPLPTPAGWTTMGEVGVGDEVIDAHGRPCRVSYTSPVYVGNRCFELVFDDGSTLVADAGHRWLAYDLPAWKSHRARSDRLATGPPASPHLARDQTSRIRRPRVVTTQQMVDEGVRAGGRPNWYLPMAGALDLPEHRLPVDPYVLGCWLGDGNTGGSSLTLHPDDAGHFVSEFNLAGHVLQALPGIGPMAWATAPIAGKGRQGSRGPRRVLARELQEVSLLGGAPPHIPPAYLRGSVKQRLALLQGLMDTAGTVTNANGTVELCLANVALLEQAWELVASLGHKPHRVVRREFRLPDGRRAEAWRFRWSPPDPVFRLGRKAEPLAATVSRRRNGRHTRRAVVAIREVPSVPVRCISVENEEHLFLAGRAMVPTHNTAFALGIVAHAAMDARVPVLLFSLEMSHHEITQRLLCAEARVDATRMRNGRLLDTDWPKISHAIGRLGEAPIFVDDNPNLTVMDIRAKARRLKSREGLGLVVVDYLQLMTGRHNAENRQVEVSEISRGLKILARELQVPVIALSQLSRNLEARADKRPMLADLRESGCMPASTRLARADGTDVGLGELVVSGEQPLVWALGAEGRLVASRLVRAFASGVKPVFRLHLRSGLYVDASANHPFRTADGSWVRLDRLAVGDRLATAPTPVPAGRGTVATVGRPAVVWDEVAAIRPLGEMPTFDATVEGTHSFVADGVIAHNSLEQDADVVMFLYRDEVYNPESADRGTAEVIVSKHRNGPTGVCQLAFLSQYTRFANMARI
ncbi:MAG TPA: replicative DNA helicase [Acidimicrobiales bacterium]|nr:replicative DNA helicase [Acidimicrobiales bacterium]